MLQINQFKIIPSQINNLVEQVAYNLGIKKEDILELKILKKSIDARKKPDIFYIYSLCVRLNDSLEKKIIKKNKNVEKAVPVKAYQHTNPGNKLLKHSPIIIGFGPAGIFSAYLLADAGYQPIIIERGETVEKRITSVNNFWNRGILNTDSNVQFGEGGAGTFSDGKLNTGVKDKFGRNRFILETFVKFGAQENILYDAKPHIGTDVLCKVIENMRNAILEMGATILFSHKFESIIIDDSTGTLNAIKIKDLNSGEDKILDTECCILAIGHSARDTFELLYNKGVYFEQKPFALGLRVIHSQDFINRSQYGLEYADKYGNILPSSPYKLTAHASNGRGVYSFCMCPGGFVVNASSETGMTAVNGMSNAMRDSGFSNSAIVVSVSPADYHDTHPLAGMYFQRNLENKSFELGTGKIPVSFYSDFKTNTKFKNTLEITSYKNAIKGDFIQTDLHALFPEEIIKAFIEGMEQFDKILPGFTSENPLLCALESRTSSPVKISRDDTFNSISTPGLYPCGEGAGYAGGIMSAAMDGMKVAEAIISRYAPLKT